MKKIPAANINELANGEMKAVKVDNENEVLLCKVKNKYYAVTANCPHYGAPLAEGILSNETIICPWHHSCFNAVNGDLMEPPSLDALESYEVKIEADEVKILVPDQLNRSRTPGMSRFRPESDPRRFFIIGAGAAGNAAAEALRQNGFEGRIVMITAENRLPYDRPNLSKAYLSGEAPDEWMPLRPKDFYQKNSIDILLNTFVKEVDAKKKKIITEKDEEFIFDKLLVASGGTPRKLDLPGNDLKNIFYLRTFADTDRIIESAQNAKKIAIIGGSFIGMESCHHLKERTKLPVTIITPDETPFSKIFGEEIGGLFMDEHKKHGVQFCLKTRPVRFSGNNRVERILLDDGEEIEADLVLIGIGVNPATGMLKNVAKEKDGSIKVNRFFQVEGFEDIYAVGDIATYPDHFTGKHVRIEHWRTAEQHGRTAAFNMTGKKKEYDSIPFFWTDQAGLKLRYVGHAGHWDEIFTSGKVKSKEFISYYIKDGRIDAAAGINRDKEMAALNELMRLGKTPSPGEVKKPGFNLLNFLQK